ncbi:kinase-like domain-containing protein [Schizophyllum commune]
MLSTDQSLSQEQQRNRHREELIALSRNASVISTSSSEEDGDVPPIPTTPVVRTPRARPVSIPRSQSRHCSRSPRASRPPSYMARDLVVPAEESEEDDDNELQNSPTPGPSRLRMLSPANKKGSRSRSRPPPLGRDFEMGDVLGEGAYSTVNLAKNTQTGQEYAIKIMYKEHLRRHNKVNMAFVEKDALIKIQAAGGHPGIVRLERTWQDNWSFFYVLTLARNGDIQSLLFRLGSISLPCARYYAAQLVDAVSFMHSVNVIHRDLKPENLLLDDDLRIKLTDFGTAKVLDSYDGRARTFVGTAQYQAPELLTASHTTRSSDLWAIGCNVYQMIAGRFPFAGPSEYLIFEKIKRLDYEFPEGFDAEGKDLVQKLLVLDPTARLGAGTPGTQNDAAALKAHPFFSAIKWDTLWSDPAPPHEAGLLKKETATNGANHATRDVGALWDELVGGDEIEWAPDAEGDEARMQVQHFRQHGAKQPDAGDPLDSAPTTPPPASPPSVAPSGERPSLSRKDTAASSQSTQNSTSDSSMEQLDERLAELALRNLSNSHKSLPHSSPSLNSQKTLEYERGRNRALTPVQGNTPVSEADLPSIIHMETSEHIVYKSTVEARSLRRRASRLLPVSVQAVKKPKLRQLVLTDKRLVLLKTKKIGGPATVKAQYAVRPANASRSSERKDEKDGKEGKDSKDSKELTRITSSDLKGDRGFVFLTSNGKSHSFTAPDSPTAIKWTQKINSLISKDT